MKWFLRIPAEEIVSGKSMHLTAHTEIAEEIAKLCQIESLQSVETEEFTQKILALDHVTITTVSKRKLLQSDKHLHQILKQTNPMSKLYF